ncbi:2-methylisocitrate lyase [Rhypophila decipiens]|uniref:2-methylisocitrate lyase n=1 Tax=Rhypophila decipiens TaxID=261697 RepID=A0AAN6Y6H5_9PEZI|nr:2-methylisocitrate lyase [Rhypophila decipiens]
MKSQLTSRTLIPTIHKLKPPTKPVNLIFPKISSQPTRPISKSKMTTPIDISQTASRATSFRSLHQPGNPLILSNIWDPISARIMASNPKCKALATASFALAHSIGKSDDDLTLEDNLSLIKPIALVAHSLNLPLTVDLQDGYAPQDNLDLLKETITTLIKDFGVVGINLEDSWHTTATWHKTAPIGISGDVIPENHAVERIKTILSTAKELGVSDFVINARSDTFLFGGSLDESIRRGKKYLEAGAETIFIFWPPKWEMKREDVQRVIDELGGKVNITCRLTEIGKGGFTAQELGQMGVARVSVGPGIYMAALGAIKEAAGKILGA